MLIAVPLENESLSMHFGHCSRFMFAECANETKVIRGVRYEEPPPHETGILPQWRVEHGAHVVITGGMGMRAQKLLNEAGIEVVTGAPALPGEEVVRLYCEGKLVAEGNACDH